MSSSGFGVFSRLWVWALLCAVLLAPSGLLAQPDPTGQVQIPLDVYEELLRASRAQAPYGHSVGTADVSVTITDPGGGPMATVSVTVPVEVLEADWVLVPLLPPGTAMLSATRNGMPLELVPGPEGLLWITREVGAHTLNLIYQVDAVQYESGYTVPIPLPTAPAARLSATVPGTALGVAVIPATGTTITEADGVTYVSANLPTGSGAQISWRRAGVAGATISRAVYSGQLQDNAVVWRAELTVDLAGDESATVDLLPNDVALLGLTVDGGEAAIAVHDTMFAVNVRGAGSHTVVADFEIPLPPDGATQVWMRVPRVPVSRFELTLPGDKSLTVSPAASVTRTIDGTNTLAVVHVPMTDAVSFSWSEAVPEAVEEELLANATIYHIAHAEEGVLYLHALAQYEITRGQTSQIELIVPPDVEINTITSPQGGIADWRLVEGTERMVTIFLDHRVSGLIDFDFYYERLLPAGDPPPELPVPLLTARSVHRQRGMVALLASRELTLEPVVQTSVTHVGENQLPAFVRQAITMTIAHTFRYYEGTPVLSVRPRVPEARQGRFDAQVDTLVSLGDVTATAVAAIEIDVKSGAIEALQLTLPAGVNFLSLAAPSLRQQDVQPDGDAQVINVEFTQEMEGQFRMEVSYERITADNAGEVGVPLIHVRGAEVEQGRVAIEALSAVEVEPNTVDHLSTVELTELPQQLVLRTTNPILLAFKYVQAEPVPSLSLRVTHHREIEVQAAIIDNAHYSTLFTQDGFAVTTALFMVRNSREQFLRVHLPPGSEVWAASVNGQAETPALAENSGAGEPEVLINIINSSEGFPVELIYATQLSAMGLTGHIENQLPQPDMVVTQTMWDIYLPEDVEYGTPDTELNVIEEGVPTQGYQEDLSTMRGSSAVTDNLRISVPEAGVRFRFEGLYTHQREEAITVSIPYQSSQSAAVGIAASLAGVLLVFLALAGRLVRREAFGVPRIAVALIGGVIVLVSLVALGVEWVWPVGAAAGFAVLTVIWAGLRQRAQRKREEAARQAAAPPALPPAEPPAPAASEPEAGGPSSEV